MVNILEYCHTSRADRDQYQLGTLSHYLNQRCAGYADLAPFSEEGTDSSLRNVEGYGVF